MSSKSNLARPAATSSALPWGIVSVVQTPFDPGGRVDLESLEQLVDDAMIPESLMVRVYSAIQAAYAEGSRERAQQIFRRLLPILAFTNQELATSIAFFKRLLVRKEMIVCDAMRMPGFAWDRYNLRIADELIECYLELEQTV
ncbi:MAG: hypothetical protein GXX96_37800 [Planctomycetaceae bacterium]|nr:hypothetical protein [Planctomycetaceae bacterium]